MSKPINRPFSRTELKILVYNKIKEGKSYNQAVEEVKKEVELCKDSHNKSIPKKVNFKEEFAKLKNEKD
jgi:hypothetical protein